MAMAQRKKRKIADKNLIKYQIHLEDIVEKRTANLKRANEVLLQSEEQREKLISELQTALDEIKTLKGIIPICSYCKKIRDDQGYWNQLEGYIQEHSEAEFSHGVCKDCIREHYPDFEIAKKKRSGDPGCPRMKVSIYQAPD